MPNVESSKIAWSMAAYFSEHCEGSTPSFRECPLGEDKSRIRRNSFGYQPHGAGVNPVCDWYQASSVDFCLDG